MKISRQIVLILALMAGISIAALSYAPATAQETRETGKLLGTGEDGPYSVSLYGLPAQPIVSKFGFTVTVESIKDSGLITDAVVDVVAIDPDGEPEWLSPALSFPPNPTSFVGNAPRPPSRAFTTSGEWLIEIRVDGAEGKSVIHIPITVGGSKRTGTTGAGLIFVLAIGGAVAIGAMLTWRIRRIQRERARQA